MSVWTVVDKRGRTLFSGLEKAARKHVEDNFPRAHATGQGDELSTDVLLVAPGDGPVKDRAHAYYGPEHEKGWIEPGEAHDDYDNGEVEPSETPVTTPVKGTAPTPVKGTAPTPAKGTAP